MMDYEICVPHDDMEKNNLNALAEYFDSMYYC